MGLAFGTHGRFSGEQHERPDGCDTSSGLTRPKAAKLLGWEKIAVTYIQCDDIDARRIEIVENLHRTELTVLERGA
jgi:hypothetical protein